MPLYPATLQHVPRPMGHASVLRCGQQLKTALDGIHSKGYGHNDIKASNVFLDSEGECLPGGASTHCHMWSGYCEAD
jgi:serine/threonine protein kinase